MNEFDRGCVALGAIVIVLIVIGVGFVLELIHKNKVNINNTSINQIRQLKQTNERQSWLIEQRDNKIKKLEAQLEEFIEDEWEEGVVVVRKNERAGISRVGLYWMWNKATKKLQYNVPQQHDEDSNFHEYIIYKKFEYISSDCPEPIKKNE